MWSATSIYMGNMTFTSFKYNNLTVYIIIFQMADEIEQNYFLQFIQWELMWLMQAN